MVCALLKKDKLV